MSTTIQVGSGQAIIHQHKGSDEFVAHEPIQVPFGEAVSLRQLVRLWLGAAVVGTTVLGVFSLVALASSSLAMLDAGIIASVVAFCAAILLVNVNEPLGEWRSLLAERASYEASVYSLIVGDLARSRLPVAARTYRRRDETGTVVNHLQLSQRPYIVDVTVFPYGTGLYLGWRMRRRRSGATLLKRALLDMTGSIRRDLGHVSGLVGTEQPHALREAVHLSCSRGLKAAVESTPVPPEFGFPEGVPPIIDTHVRGSVREARTFGPPLDSGSPDLPATTPEGTGHGVGHRAAAEDDLTAPVSIFLSDLRGYAQVEAAVEALLAEKGYEVVHRGEPVISE